VDVGAVEHEAAQEREVFLRRPHGVRHYLRDKDRHSNLRKTVKHKIASSS
jgi:hypothetical protein